MTSTDQTQRKARAGKTCPGAIVGVGRYVILYLLVGAAISVAIAWFVSLCPREERKNEIEIGCLKVSDGWERYAIRIRRDTEDVVMLLSFRWPDINRRHYLYGLATYAKFTYEGIVDYHVDWGTALQIDSITPDWTGVWESLCLSGDVHSSDRISELTEGVFLIVGYGWPMKCMEVRITPKYEFWKWISVMHGSGFVFDTWRKPGTPYPGETLNLRILPYRPRFPGIFVNALLYGFIVFMLLWGRKTTIRMVRMHRGCCTQCGYDLRGSTGSLRCPECGWSRELQQSQQQAIHEE